MPLDPKLQKFTTASPSIVSYSYIDIANLTGIQTFYPTRSKDSGGEDFHLITQTLPCEGIVSQRDLQQEAQDFDLTAFTSPRTVTGVAYLSGEVSSAGNNSRVSIQLKKWDGSSETNISSIITSASTTFNTAIFLEIPITDTLFAEGDVLRATITQIGSNSADGFGIDPSGAGQDGAGNTYLPAILNIPFKIDL